MSHATEDGASTCRCAEKTQIPANIEMKNAVSDKRHKPSDSYKYSKTEHTVLEFIVYIIVWEPRD